MDKYIKKNTAYGRQRISWPMQIKAPILNFFRCHRQRGFKLKKKMGDGCWGQWGGRRVTEGWPMKDLELIMWSKGQWETLSFVYSCFQPSASGYYKHNTSDSATQSNFLNANIVWSTVLCVQKPRTAVTGGRPVHHINRALGLIVIKIIWKYLYSFFYFTEEKNKKNYFVISVVCRHNNSMILMLIRW